MTGKNVVATLGLIVLATAVFPPLAAYAVNRSRVRLASREAAAAARMLRDGEPRLRGAALRADVLCGPGRVPTVASPGAQHWLLAPRMGSGGIFGDRRSLSPDPWGNCYLVNLAAIDASGMRLWVLSAGPNGIIETPFFTKSESPVGDDVAMRIR